jgi:hypothetical protein
MSYIFCEEMYLKYFKFIFLSNSFGFFVKFQVNVY